MDKFIDKSNNTKTINKPIGESIISRGCKLCYASEYKHPTITSDEFWICPDCCRKLRYLINQSCTL